MARNECSSHAIVIHLTNIIINVRFSSSSSQVETAWMKNMKPNEMGITWNEKALLIKIEWKISVGLYLRSMANALNSSSTVTSVYWLINLSGFKAANKMTNWTTFWLVAVKIYTLIELQCSLVHFIPKEISAQSKMVRKYLRFIDLIWISWDHDMLSRKSFRLKHKHQIRPEKSKRFSVCEWCDHFDVSYQFFSAIECMWKGAICRRKTTDS